MIIYGRFMLSNRWARTLKQNILAVHKKKVQPSATHQKIVIYLKSFKSHFTHVDARLDQRYQRLLAEHMNASESLSAGLKALPDSSKSFASTQTAWRFYANDEVTLEKL